MADGLGLASFVRKLLLTCQHSDSWLWALFHNVLIIGGPSCLRVGRLPSPAPESSICIAAQETCGTGNVICTHAFSPLFLSSNVDNISFLLQFRISLSVVLLCISSVSNVWRTAMGILTLPTIRVWWTGALPY